MVDAIVALRLRPEICGWNRNYFHVEQQQGLYEVLLFSKTLAEVTRTGVHLCGNGSLFCTEIFH